MNDKDDFIFHDGIDYCYKEWAKFVSPTQKELEVFYEIGLEPRPRKYNSTPIVCVETGEVYNRALYLAKKLGYSEATIYLKMRKNEEFRDGYHYKRLEE